MREKCTLQYATRVGRARNRGTAKNKGGEPTKLKPEKKGPPARWQNRRTSSCPPVVGGRSKHYKFGNQDIGWDKLTVGRKPLRSARKDQ